MPAFEQSRLRAKVAQRLRCGGQSVYAGNGTSQQPFGLIEVGGDQARQRKQLFYQHSHGVCCNQTVATGGHHHRVQHHPLKLKFLNGLRHHAHQLGGMQHANLDCIHPNVFQHRLYLCGQHIGGQGVYGAHTQGVLGGDSGDGGHAITAQRTKGFQVGLNACAPATVRTRNTQNSGVMDGRCMGGIGWFIHKQNYQGWP